MAENNKKSDNKGTAEKIQHPKRCFIIMPFSDPEGYAPGHFRKVYEQIIKPAVESAGYEAYRVDENGVSDLITTKIFKAILDCDMTVCDLSSRNPNVLYELGIRHAFDKPVVLITDDKTERIFDIQGISTITYRSSRLYDEVPEDQKKITEAIKANESNSSGYSILNMINLQKASYDASIKDTDSPEINNALLMRVLSALEKREQEQVNMQNQIYFKENSAVNAMIEKIADRIDYFMNVLETPLEAIDDKFFVEANSELSYLARVSQRYLKSNSISPKQVQELQIGLGFIQRIQKLIAIKLKENI